MRSCKFVWLFRVHNFENRSMQWEGMEILQEAVHLPHDENLYKWLAVSSELPWSFTACLDKSMKCIYIYIPNFGEKSA